MGWLRSKIIKCMPMLCKAHMLACQISGGSGGMPLFCTKSLFCTIVSLGGLVTYFSKAEGLKPPHCYVYAHISIYCITYYTHRIVLGHKAHKMAGCATLSPTATVKHSSTLSVDLYNSQYDLTSAQGKM